MRPTVLLSSSLVTLLLGACSGGESGALVHTAPFPTAPTQSFAGPGSSAADVSGLWNWGARGQFTVPRAVVERLFGIEPEGPVTHLRCETSGSVQLVQSGTTFSGLATRTAGSCESGDGLVFVPPPTAWPNSLPVAEGVIKEGVFTSISAASPGSDVRTTVPSAALTQAEPLR